MKMENSGMRCETCGHKFQQFEHYVESILYKEKMCENCFFDFALAKLGAKEKQMGYEERGE